MKIYFAGSIRGGRNKIDDYKIIIDHLSLCHTVLTEHISNSAITEQGEQLSNNTIFSRDINWIKESDIVIADVTIPSLGVGYEIGYAEAINKPILCLFCNNNENVSLSAMITGNHLIQLIIYSSIPELLQKLESILSKY